MTDGHTTRRFSVTAVITAGERRRDDDMNYFIQTYNILEATQSFLSEVLEPSYTRCKSVEVLESRCNEVEGLNSRGLFSVFKRSSLSPTVNILGGRFVMSIK